MFDIDFELDYKAAGLAIVLSAVFIVMVWSIPTWGSFPTVWKVLISVILPVVSYVIVLRGMNQ